MADRPDATATQGKPVTAAAARGGDGSPALSRNCRGAVARPARARIPASAHHANTLRGKEVAHVLSNMGLPLTIPREGLLVFHRTVDRT